MERPLTNGRTIVNIMMQSVHLKHQGFTLMELLLVVVILGLLAAFVGPTLYKQIKPAKQTLARAQMQSFMTALDNYYIDNERFPSIQQGLAALRKKPEGAKKWQGPYLKKEIPLDPWGKAYIYRAPGRNGGYEIVSLGSDSKEGGKDDKKDINSWESAK